MGSDKIGSNGHANGNAVRELSRRPPGQGLLFFKNFLRFPKLVGWVLPSSRYLVDAVLTQVDWDRCRVIVEYGPGVGNFTSRVLQRMRPDARLVAFELNQEFCDFISGSLDDPRLHLVRESATEVDHVLSRLGYSEVDCVISGIPFTTLTHAQRQEVVKKTHALLRPSGQFLVYQFTTAALPYLQETFGDVSRGLALRNIVPTQLFYCSRNGESAKAAKRGIAAQRDKTAGRKRG